MWLWLALTRAIHLSNSMDVSQPDDSEVSDMGPPL